MGDAKDDMVLRLMMGRMAQEEYNRNPPDIAEWCRVLDGCSKLYRYAASHLAATPPNFLEATRCVSLAVNQGIELRQRMIVAYACSGQATDDLLSKLREDMEKMEGIENG